MTVARILAAKGREVVTTEPQRTLAEAAALLTARNIGSAVVTDPQGRVIGILWERDIVHVYKFLLDLTNGMNWLV